MMKRKSVRSDMKVLGYMLVILGAIICKLTLPVSVEAFSVGMAIILVGGGIILAEAKTKKD